MSESSTNPEREPTERGQTADTTGRQDDRRACTAFADDSLVTFSKTAMACSFEIMARSEAHQRLAQAIVAGFDLIDELERQMTVYADHSEVIAINRLAASRALTVEPGLFDLLRTAKALSERTQGAFDITMTPLSRLWGFHRRCGQLPDPEDIERVLRQTGYQNLQLDPEQRTVRFACEGLEIDLGGIGKGHALDRLANLLIEEGNQEFVIHGGQSSVVARGDRQSGRGDNRGWTIGLSHPLKSARRIGTVRLVDRALGTSGSGRQSFVHRGKRYGHVLDPRTGWPSDDYLSATVIAPLAAEADALATAILVGGAELAEEICTADSDYAAILMSDQQQTGQLKIETFNVEKDGLIVESV